MTNAGDIVFRGKDGHECEEFIRAIHIAAYTAGKIRDNEWITDFALTCFAGTALRYYQSLDKTVRNDWELLRQALLTEYPPVDERDEAQPEESKVARTGRVKAIGSDSKEFGYLGDGNVHNGSVLGAGASASEAFSISYLPTTGLFKIDIERSDGKHQVLGLHWGAPNPSTEIGSSSFATVTVFNCVGSHRSSTTGWGGPGFTRVWNVMPDNTLCPHLGDTAARDPLQFFMYKPESPRHAVDVAGDAGAFATNHGGKNGWILVKLVFEPLN